MILTCKEHKKDTDQVAKIKFQESSSRDFSTIYLSKINTKDKIPIFKQEKNQTMPLFHSNGSIFFIDKGEICIYNTKNEIFSTIQLNKNIKEFLHCYFLEYNSNVYGVFEDYLYVISPHSLEYSYCKIGRISIGKPQIIDDTLFIITTEGNIAGYHISITNGNIYLEFQSMTNLNLFLNGINKCTELTRISNQIVLIVNQTILTANLMNLHQNFILCENLLPNTFFTKHLFNQVFVFVAEDKYYIVDLAKIDFSKPIRSIKEFPHEVFYFKKEIHHNTIHNILCNDQNLAFILNNRIIVYNRSDLNTPIIDETFEKTNSGIKSEIYNNLLIISVNNQSFLYDGKNIAILNIDLQSSQLIKMHEYDGHYIIYISYGNEINIFAISEFNVNRLLNNKTT